MNNETGCIYTFSDSTCYMQSIVLGIKIKIVSKVWNFHQIPIYSNYTSYSSKEFNTDSHPGSVVGLIQRVVISVSKEDSYLVYKKAPNKNPEGSSEDIYSVAPVCSGSLFPVINPTLIFQEALWAPELGWDLACCIPAWSSCKQFVK